MTQQIAFLGWLMAMAFLACVVLAGILHIWTFTGMCIMLIYEKVTGKQIDIRSDSGKTKMFILALAPVLPFYVPALKNDE